MNTKLSLSRPTGLLSCRLCNFQVWDSGNSTCDFLQDAQHRLCVGCSGSDYLHCRLLDKEPRENSGETFGRLSISEKESLWLAKCAFYTVWSLQVKKGSYPGRTVTEYDWSLEERTAVLWNYWLHRCPFCNLGYKKNPPYHGEVTFWGSR